MFERENVVVVVVVGVYANLCGYLVESTNSLIPAILKSGRRGKNIRKESSNLEERTRIRPCLLINLNGVVRYFIAQFFKTVNIV